ncbi:BLUF domain-containing protein [Methylobacterium sp.]|jgi:hypothetical protein|uniref:BLUF domain-containing protein n=1 Tax=Methylobacterium sp. TaxID=409 RepID=UPI002637EC33|nr:BLUF domain-containing protein [Methylobacterium sp.]MDB5647277.1 Sensors of blue-light using [Methylobacterium sp.]
MSVSQIVFYSHNLLTLQGDAMREMVRDILASCSRYDRASGFTGALIFNEKFFLQGMEGETAALSEQLWTLAADSRHNAMVLVSARVVERREFRGWTVGYAGRSEALDELYLQFGPKAKLDPTTMSISGAVGLLQAFTQMEGNHFIQRSRAPVSVPAKG